MEKNKPRLLIASRNLALLRAHYEDVIVALVEAGAEVSVRFVNEKGLNAEDYRRTLVRRGCDVRVSPLPPFDRSHGDLLTLRLRELANLLRFYHPDYRGRDWLRDSKFDKAAPGPLRWARRLGRLGSRLPMLAIRLGASVDRVVPPAPSARALVAGEQPDAVAVADLIRAPQLVDLLKAAAWERISTASWIQSWDNLSSKGLLHFTPDRVFVWNETQRDELARYHRVPARHACVTGAQTFDHWFNGDSPSSRAEFCAQNGLDPERPIILYLASSRQVESPSTFFVRWFDAIRTSGDPALEGASVLVRPHPTAVDPWLGLNRTYPRLAVSPSTTAAPINSPEYRRRFRDELHHAGVAVGLNTSGMIDAAIFGKPVCTVEPPELAGVQRGTVHFEYLMTVAGGFVRTTPGLEEHLRVLAELVRQDPDERDERSNRFVQEFIRPLGLEVTPAKVFAEEMIRLLGAPSELNEPAPVGRGIGRLLDRAAPVLVAPLEEQSLRRWAARWLTFLKELMTSRLKRLTKPLRRQRKALRRLMRRKVRFRARLKPVRRLFLVRLRAAVRTRLQRFTRHREPR